jgi:hypothetical protein
MLENKKSKNLKGLALSEREKKKLGEGWEQ